jgi:flagellar protein FlaG
MIRNGILSRRLPMSIELANIGQQLTAMDRRLEGTVNSSLRNTTAALQTEKAQQAQAQQTAQDPEHIKKVVEQIQNISNLFDRKLQFQVNDALGDVVVKVIDSNTDKVIREIPSVEIQKLQIRIKEALGLLVDESR